MNTQQRISDQLRELIRTPSVSAVDPEFDMSNLAVTTLLSNWFSDAGFEIVEQAVASQPQKANLLAHIGPQLPPREPGADSPRGLVLSGHTDTVPYDAGRWASDPFELHQADGRWYGLGSADMKCFFPIILAAIEGIPAHRFCHPLQILATADEESSMAGARIIADSGLSLARYALIGEPTELVPIAKHKGILIGRIEFRGHSGHSSNPAAGRNALDAMHALIGRLIAWREQLAVEIVDHQFEVPTPTLNLGRISGGDSPNRICAQCELLFDIRLMPSMSIDATVDALHAMVAEVASEHQLEGDFVLPFAPLDALATSPDSLLVRELESLSGCSAQTVAFATEGPFLNSLGCESVIFGPGNIATAHQPNEYVEIDRVMRMVEIVRDLVLRICCDD